MKIYLVQNTSGSYENSWEHIDKVFNSKAKAQQYIESILNRMSDLKKLFNKMSSDNITDEHDVAYEKASDQFSIDFPDSNYDSWDGNRFQIIERYLE
jgi:hypothetical protein